MEMAYITFFLNGKKFAIKNKYYVPNVGDGVRFSGIAYIVSIVVWCYDEPMYPNKVNIGIEPV